MTTDSPVARRGRGRGCTAGDETKAEMATECAKRRTRDFIIEGFVMEKRSVSIQRICANFKWCSIRRRTPSETIWGGWGGNCEHATSTGTIPYTIATSFRIPLCIGLSHACMRVVFIIIIIVVCDARKILFRKREHLM
eukprot:scaffold10860_cov182-Amphora_coffeaeformis.AAC.18